MISDGRYLTQIEEECPGLEMNIRRAGILIHQQVIKILRAAGISRLAIEADSMTVATRERIAEKLPKLEIGATTGMVEHLRQVKDKEELALIRQAIQDCRKIVCRDPCRTSSRSRRKSRLAMPWNIRFRLFGGDGPAFAPIVAVGPARGPAARQVDRSPGW